MENQPIHYPSLIKSRILFFLIFGFFVFSFSSSFAQKTLTDNVVIKPMEAKFVFQDIENFLDAQMAIASGQDSSKALKTMYLDKASPGLKMFISKYDLTTKRLKKAMAKYPEDYSRIKQTIIELKAHETNYKKYYDKIRKIIPNAVFPPTYFLVAGHRGIGSGSTEGPLISIEKKTIESIKDMQGTLVHEMVHMQQLSAVGEAYFVIFSGKERTLLATSIREGGATYMAEIIAGGSKHKNLARKFYLANEKELWKKYSSEMYGLKMGGWLWADPENPDQPRDLGYAIGARIVEAHYKNAKDKQKAAQEIMAITDYPAFLKLSGYEGNSKK